MKAPLPIESSDQDLLAGMGLSDPRAASAFTERFQRRVFGLARSIVADPGLAEEIAQEAFDRAWRLAGSYDPRRGSVSAWLLGITRDVAIGVLRKRPAQPRDTEEIMVAVERGSPGPGPHEPPTLDDDRARLRNALRQLPLEQRRAIVEAAFFGRTSLEIALTEGVPLGTVKTRIHSAMVKIRELVADDRLNSGSHASPFSPGVERTDSVRPTRRRRAESPIGGFRSNPGCR
jgi:RNA polymerase sigma factor (sigma-70 family)